MSVAVEHNPILDLDCECDVCRSKRFVVLQNAVTALEYEDWLRRWPTLDQIRDMDDRARRVGKQVARSPAHVRERVFSKLWWIRFNHEPVIADLVRVGISFEEAEARMERRLAQFQRAFDGRT